MLTQGWRQLSQQAGIGLERFAQQPCCLQALGAWHSRLLGHSLLVGNSLWAGNSLGLCIGLQAGHGHQHLFPLAALSCRAPQQGAADAQCCGWCRRCAL